MLSTKTKLTNRKFYGKWLYKTTLEIEGGSLFRSKSFEEIKNFCKDEAPKENKYSIWAKAYRNKDLILDLSEFLESYDKTIYQIRVESNYIDFYSNDKNFYDSISGKFEEIVRHRFEPTDEVKDILVESSNYITVKKLPKDRYNYRVYLLPHKLAKDKEAKQKYINWIKSQNSKITCTPAVEKWFLTTDWNWDRRYVLVEDEATLLMMKLRNSEVVGRIYNFVITDK